MQRCTRVISKSCCEDRLKKKVKGHYLKLSGTALAADSVSAGAEGGVDLLLAAQGTQQRLLQPLKLLLQEVLLPAALARAVLVPVLP